MTVPDELVTAGIVAASALLINNSWKLRTVGQVLTKHIKDEDINDRKVRVALHRIRRKLPNGEVEKTFQMVRELHGYFEDEIREWKLGEQGHSAVVENARMDERAAHKEI
jgi:hypothetical protein